MTKKYIDLRQVVAAFRVAAYGVEESAFEGLTLTEIYSRLDDALRVVIGGDAYIALLSETDDETPGETGDDPETPKF